MARRTPLLGLVALVAIFVGCVDTGTAWGQDLASDPDDDTAQPTKNPKGRVTTGFILFTNGADATTPTDPPCLKRVRVDWEFKGEKPPSGHHGRVCILKVQTGDRPIPGSPGAKKLSVDVALDTSHIPAGTTYTITYTFVRNDGATEDVPLGPFTK